MSLDVNFCKNHRNKIEVPDPLAVEDLISSKLNNKRKLVRLITQYRDIFLLLDFSVTPFKIDQNKNPKPLNRLSPESGNRKKVDIQRLSPRFRSQQFFLMEDMRRNVFPKFIEICMETPCWCPPKWAPTWRLETSRNICH